MVGNYNIMEAESTTKVLCIIVTIIIFCIFNRV